MSRERHQLESDDTKLDLTRYLRVAWRRKLFVIIPVIFITSITVVGVRFMSPLFVSSSRIHLEQRTRVTKELEKQIVDENQRTRRKDQLAEVRGQISSREFLETVVRDLGLHNDPAILARASLIHETRTPDIPTEEIAMRNLVRGLRGKLRVKSTAPNTYQISVQDNDPENAYLLAKVITRSFVDEVKRERMEKLGELFKFSSQQSQIYRQRLEEAENELRDYQKQLIRERSTPSPVTVANVNQAKSYHRRMLLDQEQAERRIAGLQEILAQILNPLPSPNLWRRDPEVISIARRLQASAEEDLLAELERMRNSSANVGSDLQSDGVIRSSLRRRLTEIVDRKYTPADDFYRGKITEYAYETVIVDVERSKAESLYEKIEDYTRQAETAPERELKLRSLEERVEAARTSLETFSRTLQSAQLSETIMATQLAGGVNIVDPAEKPVAPIRPDKRRLVGLAFLLALAGGLGTIFAVEYLDKSFKEVDDVERILGLHVIGTLPKITEAMPFGRAPSNRKRAWLLMSSFAILFVVLGGMALYERLLRKQQVAVPQSRIEEILRQDDEEPGERQALQEDSAPPLPTVYWWHAPAEQSTDASGANRTTDPKQGSQQ